MTATTNTTPAAVPAKRRNYARWRAATLASVYLLMAAHVTHWVIAGKTLAPLELNEVMYTFEVGVITAGFVFMVIACLSAAIFGRFFCSWGCHILALQDLCAWILGKLRIRPQAVRSRALLWVPIAAAVYMFLWPQITRIAEGRPPPQLHLRTDAEGWASFSTGNFWRNLPSPGIIALTFGVCGFVIVYVLGTRGFCTYGCPYGAVFRVADRMAPGKIRTKATDCLQCGACTAACTSHVRVHEELNRFGMVVNPACLKDLDCVSACPKGNVYYGFGKPSLFKTVLSATPIRNRYDLALWEEAVVVAVFLVVLFVYRGLYDRIPFLMTLALGAIVGYLAVVSVRLLVRSSVQWNRRQLKAAGVLTRTGWGYLAAMTLILAFTIHSGIIRYHSFQGRRYASIGRSADAGAEAAGVKSIDYLSFTERWGLMSSPRDAALLGELHYQLAGADFKSGRMSEAEEHLRAAIVNQPGMAMAQYDLGALLVRKGEIASGIEHLRRAVAAKPEFADAHYNLALAQWMAGAHADARREIDAAAKLAPGDERTQALREMMNQATSP